MSVFSGLWKQQNNPACTESGRVFIMLKLDTTSVHERRRRTGADEVLCGRSRTRRLVTRNAECYLRKQGNETPDKITDWWMKMPKKLK